MKLSDQETARICRGLSLLLHSGISLADGLYLLSGEGGSAGLLKTMGAAMDRGESLSEAMAGSAAFPAHVQGMTAIGEKTGRLEEVLASLADFYDQRVKTARMMKQSLTYPCMILALMFLVIGVLLTEVLPVFDQVYASLGTGLTGIAGSLLQLGQELKKAMPLILGMLAACALAAAAVSRCSWLREKLGAWFYARFGDRGIWRKFNNARFAQATALALNSGLSLEEAMTMAQSLLADSPQAARRCGDCISALESGETLAQAMAAGDLLPPAESRILAVGLRCGSGEQVMADIAARLLEDAENALEDAVSRVEPGLVMACSVLVGAIILAVMLPLAGVLSNLG